ncbi:porin family protein [Hymenobacter baengnokdamensis]|uniref:porin family protein n=1 Tax=Hymenobacter baengnokdamensis TaxID=2615203 RepID=UPI0012479931|nr:porin family protein [Hymenobacter baengnokdamensis]
MKKSFFTLALLVATASAAYAQTPANTVGITLGYGRTNLRDSGPYSSVNHSAYQAGLNADVYFSESFSFHPEALYTLQYFDSNNTDLSRDISYINVPLLARVHAKGLFFEAGPEVNFALTAKNEAGNDVKSDVNPVVLDYVLGLGYQLGTGLSIGLRYDGGATNVFKNNTGTIIGNNSLKSNTFWLNVAYSFGK